MDLKSETTAIKDKQKEMIQLLSKAFYLNKNIDALKLVLQMNKSLAEKCTANYNNNGASKSISDKNGQEDIIHQIIDLSNKINEQINEMIKSRNEIADLINKSKVAEHLAILSRRYLLYQTMEQIADEMYYSSKTIQRKHKSAIEELVSLYVL